MSHKVADVSGGMGGIGTAICQRLAMDGFTVIARGDGRTLRSAGLQSGDVLLAVNGQALTPERLTELGDMLEAGSRPGASTTLTLERGDTRHTITLPSESP